jgi:hypothetical protein
MMGTPWGVPGTYSPIGRGVMTIPPGCTERWRGADDALGASRISGQGGGNSSAVSLPFQLGQKSAWVSARQYQGRRFETRPISASSGRRPWLPRRPCAAGTGRGSPPWRRNRGGAPARSQYVALVPAVHVDVGRIFTARVEKQQWLWLGADVGDAEEKISEAALAAAARAGLRRRCRARSENRRQSPSAQ